MESAPRNKRGVFGAAAFSFAIVGTMLGNAAKAITYALLDPQDAADWGWRVCYVAGFGLGIIGIQLRKGLEESPEFEKAKKELVGDNVAPENPLKEAFTKYHKEVLVVMTSVSMCALPPPPSPRPAGWLFLCRFLAAVSRASPEAAVRSWCCGFYTFMIWVGTYYGSAPPTLPTPTTLQTPG